MPGAATTKRRAPGKIPCANISLNDGQKVDRVRRFAAAGLFNTSITRLRRTSSFPEKVRQGRTGL